MDPSSRAVYDGSYQRGFIYSSDVGEFAHDSETCNQACTDRLDHVSLLPAGPPNAFLRPSFDFARMDSNSLNGNFHSWAIAGFLQDSWRLGHRFILNYGLRYEYFSPPEDSRGRTWNFDPSAGGLVSSVGNPATVDPYGNLCAAASPVNGLPSGGFAFPAPAAWTNCQPMGNRTTMPAQYNNFAPRFGFAWDLFGNGTTILRMGTGLFWGELPINSTTQLLFDRPVKSSNAIYDQIVDPGVCPGSLLLIPVSFAGCGLGNTMVSPAERSQADLSGGIKPNSFFTDASFPFAIYARDTAYAATPRALQATVNVQRQLSNHATVEAGYVGNFGRHLSAIYNSAAQTELAFDAKNPPIATFPVFMLTDRADSDYNSLLARFRAAQWHRTRLNITYVFSRSLDNASSANFLTQPITLDALAAQQIITTGNPGSSCFLNNTLLVGSCGLLIFPNINFSTSAVTTTGAGRVLVTPYSIPQDPFHFLSNDWGRSDFDVSHRLAVDYTWDVPVLRLKFGSTKWFDYWQVSGIFTAQSGQPFTIFSAPPSAVELTQRVNIVGSGPTLNMSDPNNAIPTSGIAPALPACGFHFLLSANTACIGNSGRNAFTGPAYVGMDLAVQKGFPIGGEGKMLMIRSELYDLFNRANFYNPISDFSTDGVNLNPDFGKIKSAHAPLHIQFSARFSW